VLNLNIVGGVKLMVELADFQIFTSLFLRRKIMKKAVLAGILSVGIAASVSAYDTKVVTGITNTNGAKVETYHNVGLGSHQLILGFNTGFPTESDKGGLAFSGNIGLTFDTDLPILGDFELSADFSKTATDNVKIAQALSIKKKYLVKLTDKVELGLDVNLISLDFANKQVNILSTVAPVVAMTIKI